MKTKTIAVIGGTGFLGRHVARVLETAGYAVRALSRRSGFDGLSPNPESLRGADAVVNLAGIKREVEVQTFEAVHVDLVRRLVDAMKDAGVQRLIHVSVVVARPSPNLPYHDTKWKGEEVVRSSGLDYTILRPGVIYGEGDDMLSHLARMIRTAPIFPIVGKGTAPMRPVDVRDVAAAVLAALEKPCSQKTYDIVGPDRLELNEVVRRVAEALGLGISICPTPVAVMRGPVWIMEKFMSQPLSTRAQLAMLVEGLDGNPEPARRELDLNTSPFTATRIRPLLARATTREITGTQLLASLAFLIPALTLVFGLIRDPWMGMTVVMGAALAGALILTSARRHLKASVNHVVLGLGGGVALYAISLLGLKGLASVWPGWEASVRTLYAWRVGHSPLFLGSTLVMIVLAEEVLWRGVVARYLMDRYGTAVGVVSAAAIYALAHAATLNPVLLLAALCCGVFWGCLYAVTDNLIAPTVSHLVWDILLLFLFPVVH